MAADYRDSTTAGGDVTSFNCAKPAGVISGDVLVACHVSLGTAGSMGTPSGGATWVQLGSTLTSGSGSVKMWRKIAGGSEPANYGFTQDSEGTAIIVAVMDADTTVTPIIATSTAGSGTSITTPSITPATAADFEMRFATAARFTTPVTFTPPATYTEREDSSTGNDFASASVATKQLVSAGASGAQNFVASGTPDNRGGITVAVASLASTPLAPPRMYGQAVARAAYY
jgi:hypothetical protein